MQEKKHVVVIGAGAFGTALALSTLKANQNVTLYARRPELVDELNLKRLNDRYLPDIPLPKELTITNDLSVLKTADVVLLATPAQHTDHVIDDLKPWLKVSTPLVICAKGIHRVEKSLLSGIARRRVANPVAVLSGPSFADELALSAPTAVMLACQEIDVAESIAKQLRHSVLRCYVSQDIIGVQAAGACKNVIAIASGIVDGLGMGCNTRAALLSRGLAEMMRLGVALGGETETFLGLAGVGDLFLTATSSKSRNYSFGLQLGQGESMDEILGRRHSVTEGVATTAAVYDIAQELAVYAPLTQAIYRVLHEKESIRSVITDILSRQSEREF
ncbi:MAG: NAD(P)-dependent glycerol-3-phosphate dehydrogenase [Candidatus Paracaedibacteraceae bacterium]|nr:NAD(P)-dependent glycerol-3-phosphate dehydrogenase [Candidatus Paracaedibacteraceae bacterium]